MDEYQDDEDEMLKDRFVKMKSALWIIACFVLLPQGCGSSDEDDSASSEQKETRLEKELDTQMEYLHQTREVMRYMEDQHLQQQQRLDHLDQQIDSNQPHSE